MAKKFYYMNGNGLLLCRMDIIGHSRNDINKITIDVKRLFEVTDEELMSYRNVGPKYLAKINAIREELKKVLFEVRS